MGSINPSGTLTVGVIGAGIAGLSAGIALRNAGHEVEIFEQSRFKYEVGAAITLPPNGVLAIKQLDIDPNLASPVISEHYEMLAGDTLETMFSQDWTQFKEQYGNYMLNFGRVDLHDLLRREAVDSNRKGIPVKINLSCKTKDVDCHSGTIILEDGRSVRKDLVIIADGIHSRFISAITGQDIPTIKNGKSAFRDLIPFDSIKAHPELGPYWEKVKTGFWIPVAKDHRSQVVTYPCGKSGYLNLALLHYTLPEHANKEGWTNPAATEDCIAATKGFNPLVHELLKLSTDTKVHTLHTRQPLPTLINGRGVIIGDASAPTQPQMAQGATTAIESAIALGMLFSNLEQSGAKAEISLQERLKLFNEAMHYRICLVQLMSDCIPYDPNDPLKVERRKQMEVLTEGRDAIPPIDYPPHGDMVRDLLYGHDVVKRVTKTLSEHGFTVASS